MRSRKTCLLSFALCFLILFDAEALFAAHARGEDSRVVRVGWYECAFNMTDRHGRRSGYAYEYQRKIAAYTGWTYEYVEGSWPELMQMLRRGEIDLMSDVSFKQERTADILYSSLPMGTEVYDIFVAADGSAAPPESLDALNGKTIGVTEGSIQQDLFREWAEAHEIRAELVGLTGSETDSMELLRNGRLDAFVTLDIYGGVGSAIPIAKIGSSDFYFAVSKARPELLAELDAALNRIQDENLYYNQQLYEKYLKRTETSMFLDAEELDWLDRHGAIRVGYQDDYLAFCASDGATGELTGALKDYLAFASGCLENARLDFEAVSYPTASDAMDALRRGEVDCIFPANLTDHDSETLGFVMSPPLMRTEMDAVVRAAEQKSFVRREQVTVAVNQGNTNYDMFLEDHYPGWQRAYYADTPDGLEAVAAGEADCVIISNYRFNNISRQCKRLRLTSVYTGVDMDYCFALRVGETELYSILARVTGLVPGSVTNAALTYYSAEDVRTGFAELLRENLFIVTSAIAAVLLLILILLLRSIRAENKARMDEHLIRDLNRRVFVDALTSVQNATAYADCIRELQRRLDREDPAEFAVGVFDCNDLKTINDRYGHEKGDIYLKTASRAICRTFQHSPVFRTGGDEFAVLLQDEDYQNRLALAAQFRACQQEICSSAREAWEEAHIAMGIAAYDPRSDGSVRDTMRRADKTMYEDKRAGKAARRQRSGMGTGCSPVSSGG